MAIIEIHAGPPTFRSLMNKTKSDLARLVLDLTRRPSPVAQDAQFLLDRLAELEIPEELARDWMGHVEPAVARLRAAITADQ